MIRPEEWTMDFGDEGVPYPFVEDENCNITGLGHQDEAAFAAAVNRYDTNMNGEPFPEDEQWDTSHVGHHWAVVAEDGERLYVKLGNEHVTENTPSAIAITTLWGQR